MFDLNAIGAPAFVVNVLPEGGFRYAAANAAHVGPIAAAAAGLTPKEAHPPALAARVTRQFRDCVARRTLVEYDVSAQMPTGFQSWRTWLMPVFGPDGGVTTLMGICHDLSDARAAERDMTVTNEHLSLALQALHGAEWHVDMATGQFRASDAFALLMGEEAPRPVPWAEWRGRVHPDDRNDAFRNLASSDDNRLFRFLGRDGETRWARCQRTVARGADGAAETVSGVVADVTEERLREIELEELATRDPLTGLLNRRGFRREVDRAGASWPADACLALFMVDLDRFKDVNDVHGHAAGDAVLAEAARRLEFQLGEGAVCARLGGDEFVALRPVARAEEAAEIRAALARALGRPLLIEGLRLPMSASVGLASTHGEADVVRLMAEADVQLYGWKKAGRAKQRSAA